MVHKTSLEGLLRNFTTCLNKHDRVYSGHFAQIIVDILPSSSFKEECVVQILGMLLSDSQFSYSVMSNSLQPHGSHKYTLSITNSQSCSNSCPLSQWCHSTISSSVAPSLPAFNLPNIRVFSSELAFCIKWPKYWSFSFSIRIFIAFLPRSKCVLVYWLQSPSTVILEPK